MTPNDVTPVEENKRVARDWVDGFKAGDVEAIESHLADDVTWFVSGSLPVSGRYVGRDAVMKDFLGAGLALYDSLAVELTNLVAEGENVVVEWHARGRGTTGRAYDNFYCLVLTMRDGKIAAVREYLDTLHAREALWD